MDPTHPQRLACCPALCSANAGANASAGECKCRPTGASTRLIAHPAVGVGSAYGKASCHLTQRLCSFGFKVWPTAHTLFRCTQVHHVVMPPVISSDAVQLRQASSQPIVQASMQALMMILLIADC